MKKKGDVKFIIYQSLYIFVVCVIAIKGANLDLVQVVADDGKVRAEITPDSLIKLQDLLSRSRIVDTNLYAIVDKNLLKENKELQRMVEITQQKLSLTVTQIQPQMQQIEQQKIEPPKEEVKIDPGEMQEIRIGSISLTQYTSNTLNNPYDVPLEVVGITTIPPKSTKTFETGGQGSVVIKVGTSSKTVELKPNDKPKINFQRVASMGEETRVTSLQSSVCYRVTVSDDFPGQLDVKFSGPVTVKQQGNTYDVTMNAFSSKGAFDNFSEGKDAPYSLGFTVTVSDKIAGHKIAGQNSFYFGEW
ncbi:MAG: hypothetical protein EHM58_04030 [Ignavibacteriae bacterium]|nr:MAG: hypothetical protein EHM58_04030 [Ignavibacteriota bacterium]